MSNLFKLSLRAPYLADSIRKFSALSIKSAPVFTTNLKTCCQQFKHLMIRRPYSATESEQNAINFLKRRLTENKEKNILVYECIAKSGIVLNLTGALAAVFLLGTSYNSFLIFDSTKFKSQKFEDDGSLQSYIFKCVIFDNN